jgi:hypothetical protein
MDNSLLRQPNVTNNSFLRVFHASPNAPAVDVYINETLVVRRLAYKGFSTYLSILPGRYNIKVYPAGKKDTPVINTNTDVPARSIITAAAIGTLPGISLLPILEPVFATIPGKAYVRFSHLSPNAPNVDLVTGGQKIFSNVAYKNVTNYVPVNPGVYTFNVNSSANNQRVLYVPNIRLLPNKIYTIYAVGLAGETPPLQVVIPLDGNTYLKV